MIDLVKSVPVGTVFLRNPLILRVFRAHIEAGRHQKAWDMALCFAWKYIPTYKVQQLFAIAAHSGVRFSDLHRTPGVYLTRANMQVGPFVGMCLKPIAERLWVLGIGVDDIRLMRFADTLSDSGVDTDIRGAEAVGRERRTENRIVHRRIGKALQRLDAIAVDGRPAIALLLIHHVHAALLSQSGTTIARAGL